MDVKGLHQSVLRGMSMKSRIALLFVMAAFLNPVSVFAIEAKAPEASGIVCKDWANNKAKDNAIKLANGTAEVVNGRIVDKVKTSNDAG